MRKTIYLHIGHYKTGTTALQVFLTKNRRKLLKRGVDYPEAFNNHAKHSKLAFSIYRATGIKTLMHGYRDRTSPEAVWGEIFDAARASNAARVVVSSEEFMRMGAHPAAAARLEDIVAAVRDEFDFHVVGYLRSPGAHLHSWYNQLVKMKTAPSDFNTAVTREIEPVHYDYALAIAPWIDIFGPQAVTLRPYQGRASGEDALFADFLKVVGVDYARAPLGGWSLPERNANPRLDDRLVELSRAIQVAKLPKPRQDKVLKRAGAFLTTLAQDDFDEIRARARDGIVALAELPGAADVVQAALDADLPSPVPKWRGEMSTLLAQVLSEDLYLQKRIIEDNAHLRGRLETTEARLEALERKLGCNR